MTHKAHILKGSKIAARCLKLVSRQIQELQKDSATLTLATIQVGQARDTELYSNFLANLLKQIGIRWISYVFSSEEKEDIIISKIGELNRNSEITGIMVFSPLPKKMNPANILNNIHILKDVEGRTFLKSHFGVFSPTANAVLTLIESQLDTISGKEAVVIGHSDLVGKPCAVLLMDKMATVTVCHAKTRNLKTHVEKADIVVAAVGMPNVIKGAWIKRGAIVIDVGENMVHGKITGDVEFKSACQRAAAISPVPGGVGPVTHMMLIKNIIALHRLRQAFNGSR